MIKRRGNGTPPDVHVASNNEGSPHNNQAQVNDTHPSLRASKPDSHGNRPDSMNAHDNVARNQDSILMSESELSYAHADDTGSTAVISTVQGMSDNNTRTSVMTGTGESVLSNGHSPINGNDGHGNVHDDVDDGITNLDESFGFADDEPDDGKSRNWLWIIAILVVLVLIGGIGFGVWHTTHNKPVKIDNTSKVSSGSIGGKTSGIVDETVSKPKKSVMDTIGVPKYYQQDRDVIIKDSHDEYVKSGTDAVDSAPVTAVMALTSKASNPKLTDNPDKAFNEDGTVNPDYSFLTRENTIPLIRDDLERLVNPVYGGWSGLQTAYRMDVNGDYPVIPWGALTDMFDSNVDLSTLEAMREKANLFADWDADYYNGTFNMVNSVRPIYGQVLSYDCEFNVVGSTDDTVMCKAQVRYSVPSVNNTVETTVDKEMTVNYKVNYDNPNSSRRLLLVNMVQN